VAAPIIQGIAETGELPTKARLRGLFEFIATLVVRVPRHRRWLSNFVDSVARSHLGWATPHTTALIPLTRRVVLIGSMDDAPAPYRAVRDRRVIAELNAFTVENATRWVYSPTDDFVWRKPDGAMGHASDLRALVAEAAKA
jgi:hypothetical protein